MKNVAILVQNLHNGGAERMAANLSIELAKSSLYLMHQMRAIRRSAS